MIRIMVWQPGAIAPSTPVIKQTSDVSPAMAMALGNAPIGIEDYVGGETEMIYLGKLADYDEWEHVVAIVNANGVAEGLPVNEHATVMARFLGAHPRDIPHEGLHGTVVFANREVGGGVLTNVHPSVVAYGMAGPDRMKMREGMELPDSITIPPGVIVDTVQLFQTNSKARRAGCDLLLPEWTASMLSGTNVYHTMTNQSPKIQHTHSGVAFLRCHVLLAVFVDQKPSPQPFPAWMDVPLMQYITLPVPAKWDPSSPGFRGGNVYQDSVTVGDMIGLGLEES